MGSPNSCLGSRRGKTPCRNLGSRLKARRHHFSLLAAITIHLWRALSPDLSDVKRTISNPRCGRSGERGTHHGSCDFSAGRRDVSRGRVIAVRSVPILAIEVFRGLYTIQPSSTCPTIYNNEKREASPQSHACPPHVLGDNFINLTLQNGGPWSIVHDCCHTGSFTEGIHSTSRAARPRAPRAPLPTVAIGAAPVGVEPDPAPAPVPVVPPLPLPEPEPVCVAVAPVPVVVIVVAPWVPVAAPAPVV